VAAQGRADRGRRGLHAKLLKLTFDALVSPAGVLLGQADDQLLDILVERWPPLSPASVGPGAGDEVAVPAQERLRLHEEARPAGPRQCPADGGKEGAVGGLKPGTCDLAAQHRELVARISRSFAASPRASSTRSWMERQRVR
jgi:hypothetical protein